MAAIRTGSIGRNRAWYAIAGPASATRTGGLDTSETKDVFGDRAADRARGIRDRRGTGQVFLPDRGVTCNSVRKVCYDNGVPDFSQTRRYFGDRAADALD